jgi:hypothetical protein
MVSGKPLTDRERRFIEENRNEKFPTVLARHLALHYAEDNNGSRSTRTVQEYIRKLEREAEKKAKAAAPARASG